MNAAVGKLGSYISRSASIASGPYYPFGGAVDIIVVEQPDGSFKSSPWYVRFGKFQGFLQAREKIVGVCVNGVEADFCMYLDHKGEAFFLREIDVPDVSLEDIDGGSHIRSSMKSTSCDDEACVAGIPGKADASVEKTMSKDDSRGCRISGPVSGMEDGFSDKKNGSSVVRTKSMERAEMAADLLEVKWCTNLVSSTRKKKNVLRLSSPADEENGHSVISDFKESKEYVDEAGTKCLDFGSKYSNVMSSILEADCAATMEESKENENSRVASENTGSNMTYAIPEIIYTDTHNHQFLRCGACYDSLETSKFSSHELSIIKKQPAGITCVSSGFSEQTVSETSRTARLDIQNSGSSEVELLFGDLDDSMENETQQLKDPIVSDHEKDTLIDTDANEVFLPDLVYGISGEMSAQKGVCFRDTKLKSVSSEINISGSLSEEVRAARSLPNMWTSDICESDNFMKHVPHSESSSSYMLLVNDYLNIVEPNVYNDHQLFKSPQRTQDSVTDQELKTVSSSPVVENSTEDVRDMPKAKVTKMKVRESTPSSAQLASLNLKDGRNTVTFTFSTPMLGKQKVDAQIHLWKWDTRIVISDVDGTITRSDLLGQVMPWVGVDWLQTGVADLFSAIKENGYQVLFLSARAISQSYGTRQFIFNLKQDGKALPEGPVVISPDGIFPSLYREVVRRTPHEFKISCLEAIRALFPLDRNPFYAGFGNRPSDEISYLKVGIPKGKIFIINPKGEIVVNHHVDRKSYTCFHALVHDMFPLMSSSEQEDYNSWNYWKLPLPPIEI